MRQALPSIFGFSFFFPIARFLLSTAVSVVDCGASANVRKQGNAEPRCGIEMCIFP